MNEPDWKIDNAGYHAETAHVSHSALEVYRRSPLEYYETYVAQTMQRGKPSAAMNLGTALHVLLLEPNRWDDLVAICPDVDRRTKEGKAKYAEFDASCDGKTIINHGQFETISRMFDAVMLNNTARTLLGSVGQCERSIRWEHKTGVKCKARFDKLLDDGIILDIKTAANPNPEAWSYNANRFGYARQGALYLEGYAAVFNHPATLLYLVIGSEPPYECGVFSWMERSLALGHSQNQTDIERLVISRETGDWSAPWTQGIQGVELPRFAFGETDVPNVFELV